jgi:hypothetical protein
MFPRVTNTLPLVALHVLMLILQAIGHSHNERLWNDACGAKRTSVTPIPLPHKHVWAVRKAKGGGLLVAAPPALRQTTMACETSRKWTKFGSNLSTNAVE